MTKPKTVSALLMLGMTVAPSAFAASANWYNNVEIVGVFAGPASGRMGIYVKYPGGIDLTGCATGGAPTTAEFTLDRNNPYFKEIYSMIMIASATGKSISVYTDGVCSQYGVNLSDVNLNK